MWFHVTGENVWRGILCARKCGENCVPKGLFRWSFSPCPISDVTSGFSSNAVEEMTKLTKGQFLFHRRRSSFVQLFLLVLISSRDTGPLYQFAFISHPQINDNVRNPHCIHHHVPHCNLFIHSFHTIIIMTADYVKIEPSDSNTHLGCGLTRLSDEHICN